MKSSRMTLKEEVKRGGALFYKEHATVLEEENAPNNCLERLETQM